MPPTRTKTTTRTYTLSPTRSLSPVLQNAITLVSNNIIANNFGLSKTDSKAIENSYGEGVLVYVEESRFMGVKRNFIWVTVDEDIFVVNSPGKLLSPHFPSREGDETVWRRTGLDMSPATQLIDIIWGNVDISSIKTSTPQPTSTEVISQVKFGFTEEQRKQIFMKR
jgi:hypothetical protein